MRYFTLFAFFLTFALGLQAQSTLPAVDIKTMDGKAFNSSNFQNDGKPIIISFWATWCKPCILELTTVQEHYKKWQEETGVKLIAISIDDARNMAKVPGFVAGRGWKYEVYVDPNSDLKRALGVNNVPHTFVLNGKNEVVWQHNSYTSGDEDELYEVVKKVAKGEPLPTE